MNRETNGAEKTVPYAQKKTQHYQYTAPAPGAALPLVIGSPHSGLEYPADFKHDCPIGILRLMEDAYVDLLTIGLDDFGAHLLNARFPRSYIDPNRRRDCLDPKQIRGGLNVLPFRTGGINAKTLRMSTGLIFMRSNLHNFEIYKPGNRPTEEQILKRLDCWDAYHGKLKSVFNGAVKQFGAAYMLDMHSCRRLGTKTIRSDIILSNNSRHSCRDDFTSTVADAFRQQGLSVALNKPFKGGYITRHYGRPQQGKHCLQVEIARDLYMDQDWLELHPDKVDSLKESLRNVTATVADFIRAQTPSL